MIEFVPITENKTQQAFRLVHISDPHLSSLDDVSWRELLNKRILGYLSWYFSRRHIHRQDILNNLVHDLDSAHAHHLVISGDLTHIGTPSEYKQVSNWLTQLGTTSNISLIPGNHDAYIKTLSKQTSDLWSAYMQSDFQQHTDPVNFPSLRIRGPLAIIGVSSAVPTAPFFATGQIGNAQRQRLADLLKSTEQQGLFRVVVVHHGPLIDSNKYRKRLVDAEQFRSVIKTHGAELILHGHGHYPVNGVIETARANIPVIGVASASLLSTSTIKRAGYNIYEVNATSKEWILQVRSRRYDRQTGQFMLQQELEYKLPKKQDRKISA